MLTLLTAAALAAPSLDLALLAEDPVHETLTAEAAQAVVTPAAARLDAMLAAEPWFTATEIPGTDPEDRWGPSAARLDNWAAATTWTYTPTEHAVHGDKSEGKGKQAEAPAIWDVGSVQSNVKLVRAGGPDTAITEMAFWTKEIVGERMPTERNVQVWLRFSEGAPVEALVRYTLDRGMTYKTDEHWAFSTDADGKLLTATSTRLNKEGGLTSQDEASYEGSRRTWGAKKT